MSRIKVANDTTLEDWPLDQQRSVFVRVAFANDQEGLKQVSLLIIYKGGYLK